MPRPYFAMGRRPRKKMGRFKKFVLLTLILITLVGYLLVFVTNRTIIPVVTTIASQRAVVLINEAINESIIAAIAGFGLTSQDFFDAVLDEAGRLSSLSVNTILINQVASILAVDISRELSEDNPMAVAVPIGLFTGVPIFANLGPDLSISVIPTGEATVEYETSFTAAGINQINFQVWLVVETTMRIVIPLQETVIPVSRRVPLVNTVFAGEVPDGMILTDFGILN